MPHLGVTGALFLALLCVGTLVWFVTTWPPASMSAPSSTWCTTNSRTRSAVSASIRSPPRPTWSRHAGCPWRWPSTLPPRRGRGGSGRVGRDRRDRGAAASLRPGDYLFPGAPVAELMQGREGVDAEGAIRTAFSLGSKQAATQDPRVRCATACGGRHAGAVAGIDDPFTAIAVIDRLGPRCARSRRVTCPTARSCAATGWCSTVRWTDYPGLCDAMFHLIRQNASGSPAVLIHLLETWPGDGGRDPPGAAGRVAPPRRADLVGRAHRHRGPRRRRRSGSPSGVAAAGW